MKTLYKIPFVLSLMLLLSASACNPTKPDTPPAEPQVIVPQKQEVVISQFLLDDCPPLESFEKREYKEGEAVKHLSFWMTAYKVCASKHSKQTAIIKKAFNIKSENQSSK